MGITAVALLGLTALLGVTARSTLLDSCTSTSSGSAASGVALILAMASVAAQFVPITLSFVWRTAPLVRALSVLALPMSAVVLAVTFGGAYCQS